LKIKITFLGTAGWLGLNNSETSCILIEEKKFNLILDLGTGVKNINNIKIKKNQLLFF
jgi:ribonuclease BN (tRNA processing enzyme)